METAVRIKSRKLQECLREEQHRALGYFFGRHGNRWFYLSQDVSFHPTIIWLLLQKGCLEHRRERDGVYQIDVFRVTEFAPGGSRFQAGEEWRFSLSID